MVAALALAAAACGRDPGPDPALHDTKYAAIGVNGSEVRADGGQPWGCVLDRFTGLTWEAKDDAPGLHDWRNTYTWYDPDEAHDRGLDYRGTPDGGRCAGSRCDTTAFVAAVNAAGRCGFRDWRLPSKDELASISDPRRVSQPPTINTRYFLHAEPVEYWSGNDYSFQWDAAWAWNFRFGHDRVDWKREPKPVRLVRGEPLHLARVKD
jgi:hypothetical protein